ncbi:MAG TPA: ABC transporter substrate-binding protein [Gemmatimonadales bacterium]|nr:ABC transporter substrate-binding protein [Gemmatimonadales bacterium]
MIGTRLLPVPRPRARLRVLSGLLAGVLTLAACGGRGPVRIGLQGTFGDPLGLPERFGAKLAADQINAAGGIGGRPIEFVEVEDYGIADSAVTAALTLAKSDVVAVIGGSFSGPTLAAAPVYNDPEYAVAQITPSGSSPDISSAGTWTFRVCPSDLSHAATLARFVRQTLKLDRGAVLYMNNNYGRGFRTAFEEEFIRLGGTVVSSDPYLPEQVAAAAPFVERIAHDRRAQFILAASYETDGAALLRMARGRGLAIPFLGGDGLEGLEREGPVAEGTYQTAAYLANLQTSVNTAWVAQYRAAFPDQPPPNQTAVATYDAVRLLAQLIGEVGTDRERLRDALAEVGTARPAFEGISGRIAFDSVGDVPAKRVLVAQAHNGVTHAVEGQ